MSGLYRSQNIRSFTIFLRLKVDSFPSVMTMRKKLLLMKCSEYLTLKTNGISNQQMFTKQVGVHAG